MNAIGRALARGVSGAATAGAGALMKDYERSQDVAAKMTLADHEAALRDALQAKQNAWAAGEADLGRKHQSSENRLGRDATAALQTERITSDDARAKADRDAAMQRTRITEGGANARAAMANDIAQQRNLLDKQKFEAEQAGALPASIKADVELLKSQASSYAKQIIDLKPEEDPTGTKAAELRALASGAVKQAQDILSAHRASTAAYGSERTGGGALAAVGAAAGRSASGGAPKQKTFNSNFTVPTND